MIPQTELTAQDIRATMQTVNQACRDLEQNASGNRIQEHLNEQLSVEQLDHYEQQINEALAAHLPQQLQSYSVEAAINEDDKPCYTKTPELGAYTCRRKPKAGTGRFLRIVSLYVTYRQMRLMSIITK